MTRRTREKSTSWRSTSTILISLLVLLTGSIEARRLGEEESKSVEPGSFLRANKDVRVLAFGTSQTWGAALDDRFTQAFAYLISPNVKNLAMRASSPVYPAMCAESMLGHDSVYDVILLEYMLWTEGLDLLARRLRQRYPDALIIIIEVWHSAFLRRVDTGQYVTAWVQSKLQKHVPLHSKEFQDFVAQHSESKDWEVHFSEFREDLIQRTASEVGAHIYHMPVPDNKLNAIIDKSHWFAPDGHHLSADGHVEIARGVAHIINNQVIPTHPRIGDFGHGDSCLNWFAQPENQPHFLGYGKFTEFSPTKFAVEVATGGIQMDVYNPFPHDQTLYVMYMAMGPPPSKYPTTLLVVGDERKELDTVTNLNTHQVHVTKMARGGTIPPGKSTISFFPLQTLEMPFRLTGYAISMDIGGEDVQENYGH